MCVRVCVCEREMERDGNVRAKMVPSHPLGGDRDRDKGSMVYLTLSMALVVWGVVVVVSV